MIILKNWQKSHFHPYIFRQFPLWSLDFIFPAFNPYLKKRFPLWSLLLHQRWKKHAWQTAESKNIIIPSTCLGMLHVDFIKRTTIFKADTSVSSMSPQRTIPSYSIPPSLNHSTILFQVLNPQLSFSFSNYCVWRFFFWVLCVSESDWSCCL